MKTVILGQDDSISNQASDGSEEEGVQSTSDAFPSLQPPEAQAYGSCTFFCDTVAITEVWQDIEVIGHYPANVQIDITGYWRAGLVDVGAGASAQVEIFVRDSTGVIDDRFILNKISGSATIWDDEDSYWETLAWPGRLSPGIYEVGLRATVAASSTGAETAFSDIHRTEGSGVTGFSHMDNISLQFTEEVNPLFDGPDLNNPKPLAEVGDLIEEWNKTGEMDGIAYSQDEVDTFVTQYSSKTSMNPLMAGWELERGE